MKSKFAVVLAVCACAALFLVSTAQMLAQETQPARYSGTITILNKDTKTISLRQKDAAVLQIKYTDQTQYTYRNESSSADELKEGRRVIVLIDPNQKKELVAVRIDIRE